MSYGGTTSPATMLIYYDVSAWDNWRLQVNSNELATAIKPYLAYTDGYAIKATVKFNTSALADGDEYGQCIQGKSFSATGMSMEAASCYIYSRSGADLASATYSYKSYYGS